MKNILSIIFIISVLSGCATSTRKMDLAEKKAVDRGLKYKANVQTESPKKISGNCKHETSKLGEKWNWKDAVEVGNLCAQSKDWEHLEKIGNWFSLKEPSAVWGPYYLGLVAREKKQFERAQWMSELALKRGSEIGLTHYLKGQILWDRKEYDGAVTEFTKACQLDQSLWPAQLLLGQVFFRDQDFNAANEYFKFVIKSVPNHSEALLGLAESEVELKNPEKAVQYFSQLSEMHSDDGFYLKRMAEIYESQMKDPESALKKYKLLSDRMKAGKISKNLDKEVSGKIMTLEKSLALNNRSVAKAEEKKPKASVAKEKK